jgi:hypothetical protein
MLFARQQRRFAVCLQVLGKNPLPKTKGHTRIDLTQRFAFGKLAQSATFAKRKRRGWRAGRKGVRQLIDRRFLDFSPALPFML